MFQYYLASSNLASSNLASGVRLQEFGFSFSFKALAVGMGCSAMVSSWLLAALPVQAVPETVDFESVEYPAEADIPEEILRTEIITEARSPLTGEPLSAAEYAQLQSELAESAGVPLVSEDLRYLIFLLQFRRAVKPIIPFL